MIRLEFAYYAHPIGYYQSDAERREVAYLESIGYQVVNPADFRFPEGWRSRRIMDYCLDAVRVCDAVVFKRYANGDVGAGVAREVLEAYLMGKPVLEVVRNFDRIGAPDFYTKPALFCLSSVLTVSQTRRRNEQMNLAT